MSGDTPHQDNERGVASSMWVGSTPDVVRCPFRVLGRHRTWIGVLSVFWEDTGHGSVSFQCFGKTPDMDRCPFRVLGRHRTTCGVLQRGGERTPDVGRCLFRVWEGHRTWSGVFCAFGKDTGRGPVSFPRGGKTPDVVRCPCCWGEKTPDHVQFSCFGFRGGTSPQTSEPSVVVGLAGLPSAAQGLGFRLLMASGAPIPCLPTGLLN